MIRRMADKLANKSPTTSRSMTVSSSGTDQLVQHSPSPSLASTQSASAFSSEHRPSISTQATSIASEDSKLQDAMQSVVTPTINIVPSQATQLQPQVRRQTGSYRLTDFIIHRTLGTGSFGRVHLGVSRVCACSVLLILVQCEVNITCAFMPSKSSTRRRLFV